MTDINKRGLDSLISQNSNGSNSPNHEDEKYTKAVGFKVTERQYETYRRYSKYFGADELINKWREDLDRIEKEKGEDLQNIEAEVQKRLKNSLISKNNIQHLDKNEIFRMV